MQADCLTAGNESKGMTGKQENIRKKGQDVDMRKYLKQLAGIGMAAVTVSAWLGGCSSAGTGERPAQIQAGSTEEKAEASEGETADNLGTTDKVDTSSASYHIIVASAGTPGDCLEHAYLEFKEKVESKTDGDIAVEIFMDSQLGAISDYIAGLQMDTIQLCDVASTALTSTSREYEIFDLPYLVSDPYKELEFLNGEIGEQLAQATMDATGITTVGFIVRNPRNVYSSRGPINGPEDFKNLTIRTMDSAPMTSAMTLLGATATPIAASERYLALQTGVVDAAENTVGEIWIKKEYEVTSYLSKTEHLIQPNVLLMSTGFLENLPQEYAELVRESIAEAGYNASIYELKNAQVYEKDLAEEGNMTINELTDEAKQEFKEIMKPIYDQYREEIGGELMDAVENY